MNNLKEQLTRWGPLFVLAITLIVVYKLLDNFTDVMNFLGNFFGVIAPFLVGVLIAYLLYVPCRNVEFACQKSKSKLIRKKARTISIFIVYLITLLLLVIVINVIWPVVLDSIIELASNLQGYFVTAIANYNALPDDSFFKGDTIKEFIYNLQTIDFTKYINISAVTEYAKGILNVASSVFNVFVALIVSVYVLSGRNQILSFIKRLASAVFKKKTFKNMGKYFDSTNQIFFKFISSQFLDAIVVGILTSIAMSVMGIKYAPLLGFMIGLFNMIPYFGAIIAVVLASLITLITGGFSQAVWMIIVVVILQQIDANIINPKILGNSLKINPLLVIIAVTIGGAYFGILGMFLAVPIAAVLKIVVNDYIDYKNKNKTEITEEQ